MAKINVKVTNVKNPAYEKEAEEFKKYIQKTSDLAKANKLIRKHFGGGRLFDSSKNDLAVARREVNTTLPVKNKSVISVKSDGHWEVFKEFICQDTGRTLYGHEEDYEVVDGIKVKFKGKPIKLKIDEEYKIEKNGHSLKEQIASCKNMASEKLRSFRQKRKTIRSEIKEYRVSELPEAIPYEVFAGGGLSSNGSVYFIHNKPGEILRLQEATKLKEIFKPKKPKTSENHMGIEIEFLCKKDKFELAKLLFKHGVSKYVELKNDGSLRAEGEYAFTHELCVLSPERQVHEVLRCVINALDEAESRVNKTCGLHVHLDARFRDHKKMFINLFYSQNILYAMNPRNRTDGVDASGSQGSAYSKRVSTKDFDEALNVSGKYYGINAKTYNTIKTLEVRLHSGSTNFEKISNWLKILINIANEKEKYTKDCSTAEEFGERLQLNDEMVAYIKQRIAKFKNKKGEHVTVEEAA